MKYVESAVPALKNYKHCAGSSGASLPVCVSCCRLKER